MDTIENFESDIDLDEIVLFQLSKILMHPLFLSSGILSRFLNFIVNETLAGRQEQIKEYTIALNVLNKPPNFVPAFDAIVRIHAKRLRNALAAYYDQEGFVGDCMITIPKGRYVPVFKKLDNRQPPKKNGNHAVYSICEPKKNRIAFMPFKTYDRNSSRASFVDSLGEELTRQFSNRSQFLVLSYHTTRMLSPEKNDIKNLVSLYQVQYIISGSIRFEHSKIKVFIELVDALSENQVWSGVYYQTADTANYFSAVDNIASEVMSDLSKIKSLECDDSDPIRGISENLNRGKTEILYLDRYGKNPKPARRLAGN